MISNKTTKHQRIAIIDSNKCKPNKCNLQCKKICPVEKLGKECVTVTKTSKTAKIAESNCTGCNMCVTKTNKSGNTSGCPFNAISIVNIPSELGNTAVHRYGENGFRIYKLPVLKPGIVTGILGQNGIGKSTIINILGNKIKPNFEDFTKTYTDAEIIKMFKGTESQKYFELLYKGKLKLSIKPQHVEAIISVLKKNNMDITVKDFLEMHQTNNIKSQKVIELIKDMELDKIIDSKVQTLSGGELQRLANTICLLKDADVYIFDEPTNYLDVKQRLKIARKIRELINPDKYIIVIEHDLSILDYISDAISIIYGTPGAYGVVSVPYSTAEAINIYFDGYIPAENIRFRKEEYTLKELSMVNDTIEITKDTISYEGGVVEYPKYKLIINDGHFKLNSSITLILGENATGKTTFMNHLLNKVQVTVSHKPQYLSFEKFKKSNGSYPSVLEFLLNNIRSSYTSQMFKTDVLIPLNISALEDKYINELSGGEMQKVWLAYCLGKDAHVYLIDEPSACLDVEQRVSITKMLKRFIINNKKAAFIIEHDLLMGTSLAQELNSQIIVLEKEQTTDIRINKVSEPKTFADGINMFLKNLDITFRIESHYAKHNRPRINKSDSVKDREQKKSGKYYG